MAISDKIWWTRKARIQTEKRLLSNAFQSQLLLLWYSLFSVSASIFFLVYSPSPFVEVSWVSFSVLILAMSGFTMGLSFKERAFLVKESYESLNTLYEIAKDPTQNENYISDEYERILRLCENHSEIDYYKALCLEHVSSFREKCEESGVRENLDRRPTTFHWIKVTTSQAKRCLMFFVLYSLPFSIFYFLTFLSEM